MAEDLGLPSSIRRIYVFWIWLSGVPIGLWFVLEVAEQGSFELIPPFDGRLAAQWLLICGAAIGLSWLGSVYLANSGPGKALVAFVGPPTLLICLFGLFDLLTSL